nr:retrotransposon protein, putative, Ty1-copia subclass [Tanacetum cinerariifolium]
MQCRVEGTLVNFTHLKFFSYLAYAHVNDGKLEPRGKKCIFLRYADGTKGYKMWCLDEDARESVDDNTTPKEVQPEEQHDLQSYSLARDSQRRNVRAPQRFRHEDLVAYAFTMAEDIKNNTWEHVKPPKGQKIVGCKWVFKKKEVKHSSIRVLLAMVALHDMELHQLDVKTTFLHGELEGKIYMRQPKGFVIQEKEDHACLLKKSLHGLNNHIDNDIKDIAQGISIGSRYMDCPEKSLWETVQWILRSLIGYVFTLDGFAISWKATLQSTVALSTIEAKYMQ